MDKNHEEIYKKHRPKKMIDVLGQDAAIKAIKKMIAKKKVPHSILITGPSGCGKTTIARILRRKVKCGKHDFKELNASDFRGIDAIRDIRKRISLAPISGESIFWLIDECHKLSNDAQNAILKMLEDTPDHVYFVLCTTDPHKLLKTIKTRCTEIAVSALDETSMKQLLKDVCKKEGVKLSTEVFDKIIDCSEGSARKALVFLGQVIDLDNDEDRLDTIQPPSIKKDATNISKALMQKNVKWASFKKILQSCDLKESEGIRRCVLGYATSALVKGWGSPDRAYLILDAFRDHFFDSGAAGVVAACYEVVHGAD